MHKNIIPSQRYISISDWGISPRRFLCCLPTSLTDENDIYIWNQYSLGSIMTLSTKYNFIAGNGKSVDSTC